MRNAGTLQAGGATLALDGADLLCIIDGCGMRIRAVSGVLWVTEESSSADHVLAAGDAIDIASKGTTIVSADQPARLLCEFLPGSALPRAVELVPAGGGRLPIALAPNWTVMATVSTIIAAVIRGVRMMTPLFGNPSAKPHTPITDSSGYAARYMKRRRPQGTRVVERVVIDQWLMWRR